MLPCRTACPAMTSASSQAQEQFWQARRLPAVEEVRPGLWSLPLPWPGSTRYTLAHVFASRRGVALIDTGWPSGQAGDALVTGLRDNGNNIQDIQGVLVTHAHGDHLGLAGKVRELSGAKVGMHPAEAEALSAMDLPGVLERSAAWLRSCGAPAAEAAHIQNLTADTDSPRPPCPAAAGRQGQAGRGRVVARTAGYQVRTTISSSPDARRARRSRR